jgi:hypothetical protein
MNAKEYRDVLAELEMSQVAAAKLFKVGSRTARRWALGEARIPGGVAIVLNLLRGGKLELRTPVMANEGEERRLENNTHRVWSLKANYKLYNPLE